MGRSPLAPLPQTDLYDLVVIGMGPAGMSVAGMGAPMGLKVCAIEKHKIGGECQNVGCIPSKSILRTALTHHHAAKHLNRDDLPVPEGLFENIQQHLDYIENKKTKKMFEQVDMVVGEAEFESPHRVRVGDRVVGADRIFVCVGTRPALPPIPGLREMKDEVLTNDNLWSLTAIPPSLLIIGGGAIGCEMAQAFARLGSKVTIVHDAPYLLQRSGGDEDAAAILLSELEKEGVAVYSSAKITRCGSDSDGKFLTLDSGPELRGAELLVAAGREFGHLDALRLDVAGVDRNPNGSIKVNRQVRTSAKGVYACGDCNGHRLLTHAAMHQGMLALMNSMGARFKHDRYVTPWTVFTEPQFSMVGETEAQLAASKTKYEVIQVNYGDYGAAIAEEIPTGFVKVLVGKRGRILGATIIGEGSAEMINELALAIQKGLKMPDIMFLQHSFPSMSFLILRASQTWMMNQMDPAPWYWRMWRKIKFGH